MRNRFLFHTFREEKWVAGWFRKYGQIWTFLINVWNIHLSLGKQNSTMLQDGIFKFPWKIDIKIRIKLSSYLCWQYFVDIVVFVMNTCDYLAMLYWILPLDIVQSRIMMKQCFGLCTLCNGWQIFPINIFCKICLGTLLSFKLRRKQMGNILPDYIWQKCLLLCRVMKWIQLDLIGDLAITLTLFFIVDDIHLCVYGHSCTVL